MGLQRLPTVVLATTVLIALSHLAMHEMNLNDEQLGDPVYQNWTSTLRAFDSASSKFKPQWHIAANNTLVTSEDAASLTVGLPPRSGAQSKSFYFDTLPKGLLIYALLVPLQQYWNLWLERWLPARPRPMLRSQPAAPRDAPEKTTLLLDEDNAEWEQRVVKRLIAEGKVQRSSISIWNTLFKWLIDLTIGKVIYEIAFHTLFTILIDHSPSLIIRNVTHQGLVCLISSLLHVGPLVSLLGFIVIPAPYRVLFKATGDLCVIVFLKAFWMTVFPKIIRTDFFQSRFVLWTEALWQTAAMEDALPSRMIDEL